MPKRPTKLKRRPGRSVRENLVATPASLEGEDAVFALLGKADFRGERAIRRVEQLAGRFGSGFHAELLWALAHLRFPAKTARGHWERIVALKTQLSKKLETNVDLRVALVDYFLEVSRKLKNPTIVELKLYQQTQAFVYRDPLTGLYNLRYLREHLAREIERAERYDAVFSLVMFDLDNFKQYNDARGHEAGNQALVAVGKSLNSSIRKADVAVRYGGEEFTLILPATPKHRALAVSERIRDRVAKRFASKARGRLTLSGGVATYPIDGLTPEQLLGAADQAMYRAKSEGKNRVCLSGNDLRSFARIPTSVEGAYRASSSEYRPLRCLDLSEGGMLFDVGERLSEGVVLDLKLDLPETAEAVRCVGQVVRVLEFDRGFEVAVSFLSFDERNRRRFLRFIRSFRPR